VLTASEARAVNDRPVNRPVSQTISAFFTNPIVYGAFIPSITLLNAVVGILLPALMTPSVFGEYSLASTIFQYGLIFDCGSGQLSDRWIPAAIARKEFDDAERLGQNLLWVRFYIGFVVFSLAAVALSGLALEHELPFSLTVGMLSALAGTLYMVSLGPGFCLLLPLAHAGSARVPAVSEDGTLVNCPRLAFFCDLVRLGILCYSEPLVRLALDGSSVVRPFRFQCEYLLAAYRSRRRS
jgi:hypothetical protein